MAKPKIVFWNVDTQYDFMRPDGRLYVQDAEKIEPNLEKLTRLAEAKGIIVVNTADWHNEHSKEISQNPDYMATFPEHCMSGTAGAKYVPATKPKNPYVTDWQDTTLDEKAVQDSRNIVILKDSFDVFAGNRHAGRIVELIKPDKAVVYGVATNVCVDFAVNGLIDRGVKVYVPTDAIKGLPNLPLEETLNRWTSRGAILTTVDYVIEGKL